MKIADSEEKMVVGNLFEVEPAQLFEPDNGQARVERVELADLNVGPVQVLWAI